MPILFGLSIGIPIFFFGDWDYGLIVGALIWSVGGTFFDHIRVDIKIGWS